MLKRIELAAFSGVEYLLGAFATDGQRSFHNNANFPWIRAFEDNYETVRKEAEALCLARDRIPFIEDLNPQQRSIVDDARWKTFFFHVFGHTFEENMDKCPGTAALLRRVPKMVMAFFSILEPGTILRPHRGIYKGVLRFHLGVRIPSTKKRCGLSVAGEYRSWANGKSFVFDDTFEHFAQNESDDYRVVLIVDFEREVPFWLRHVNRTVIAAIGRSDFVQNSIGASNKGPAAVSGGKIA